MTDPTAGPADPRNRLNDLTNREFMKQTKSFWWSRPDGEAPPLVSPELAAAFLRWCRENEGDEAVERWLGQVTDSVLASVTPPRDKLKARHPATFSETDIERLIRLFTKPGERVLDPFLGSGSTLIACARTGREGIGVELIPEWAQTARERIGAQRGDRPGQAALLPDAGPPLTVIEGDAREATASLPDDSVHFLVTSPPYWSILGKKSGMKAKAEREAKGLPTKYSEHEADLGNIADYDEFLEVLGAVFEACARVLMPKRYACVIVSDFRHGPRFYLYHADLARVLERHGYALKGITVLIQDNKNLYPFGIPFQFISNVHHQYILILQRA